MYIVQRFKNDVAQQPQWFTKILHEKIIMVRPDNCTHTIDHDH